MARLDRGTRLVLRRGRRRRIGPAVLHRGSRRGDLARARRGRDADRAARPRRRRGPGCPGQRTGPREPVVHR
ncbi:hypothetical protein F8566_09210 [Actinomadura rudentiformis]|uniref:Uncharacterized protein n=1 Tax=Actinomadura rudentiformis TaxID=359158 RepID=A0A6H9YQ14_9ACTN|nr:hypothetical protein F8566_09210 [Actinomadura rudentiformis]